MGTVKPEKVAGRFSFNFMSNFIEVKTTKYLTQLLDKTKIIGVQAEYHNYESDYAITEKSRRFYVILLQGGHKVRIDNDNVLSVIEQLKGL